MVAASGGHIDRLHVIFELVRVEQADDPSAFRVGVQEYLVRCDDGAHANATRVWDDALLQLLAAARAPGSDPALLQDLGERLRRFLQPGRFAAAEDAISRAIAERRPVLVEVVASAGELFALPWELVTIGRRHLGECPGVEVRHRWPGAHAIDPARPPAQEGGRLLVAWSRGGDPLGEQLTIDAIAAAARAGGLSFEPARDVVADASLPAIVRALEAAIAAGDPPVALHLLCHGAPIGGGYGLRLSDGRGGAQVVDSRTLRGALAGFAGHLRLVALVACDSGNPGALGARLGSLATELHCVGVPAVVAARYPVAGAAALAFTAAFYTNLLEGSCSIERAFQAARERLVRDGDRAWPSFQLYSHAGPGPGARPFVVRPYRGLLPFERQHAALYFGRDAELAEALHDLDALISAGKPRLLAIAGSSGSGKSSLALAALRTALEARGWPVSVMRPGRAPLDALAEALRARPAVLIIDQFEEVFTHLVDRGRLADATQFVRALWDLAARPTDPVAIVPTIRVDYVGRCGDLLLDDRGARLDRVVYDEAHRVFVAQMSPEPLREVIERPARRVGLGIEAGLPERLLREVAGESNALPLLEYVLDELWLRRERDTLTHSALDAVGGVIGALARHADAVVDALDPPAREQAERLLVRLVMFGSDPSTGARRREDEAELRSRRAPEAWDRAAQALIAARMIVRRDDEPPTLEIAHEAIIRHWDRLWRWYEAARDRLARRTELTRLLAQYRQYGPLSGKALMFGQELVAGLDDDDVSPEARTMLAVSAARARRALLVRRAWIGAAIGTLSVFLLVATWLYVQADRSASRSRSAQRLATAERFIADRPHLAGALLRSVDETDLFGWRQAAFTLLQSPLPLVAPLTAEDPTAIIFADGGLLLGAGDGSLSIYGAGRDAPRTVPGDGSIRALGLAPDGRNLYVLRDSKLELWGKTGDVWAQRSDAPILGQTDLYVGAQTGRVVTRRGSEFAVWEAAGDRIELVRARADCHRTEPRTEQLLCRGGDDYMTVETWSGEQLGRYESPGLGQALATEGGVTEFPGDHRFAAWSWSGDGPTLVRRELEHPDQQFGIPQLVLLPDRSAFEVQRDFDDNTPNLLCTQKLDGSRQFCVVQPAECHLVTARGRYLVVACDGVAELRSVETLAVAQTYVGTRGAFLFDQHKRLAMFDRDGRTLWRWDDLAPPSGLTVVDRGWQNSIESSVMHLPILQAERDRLVVALVLWNPDRLAISALALRPGALHEPLPERVAEIPQLAGETVSDQLFRDDKFVAVIRPASGPSRAIVGTIDADRFSLRTVRATLRDRENLRALTSDGTRTFLERDGHLLALDLRGDEASEQPVPGEFPDQTILSVDPAGRILELLATQGDARQLLDIATGQPLRLPPDVTHDGPITWAHDGSTFAIAPNNGPITLARVAPDGAVRRLATLPGTGTRTASFSADDRALVTGTPEGALVLWTDLDAERPRSLTVDVPEPIWQVGLSRDGTTLLAVSEAGELRYWTLFGDDATLRRELDARARYCLSAREWTELADVPEAEAEAVARDNCR
jgi:hypothetical protein